MRPSRPPSMRLCMATSPRSSLRYLAYAPAFCAGYLPSCDEATPCRRGPISPSCVRSSRPGRILKRPGGWSEGDAVFASVFANEPVGRSLHSLEGPPADPSVARPVSSDVPMLILLGRYDPYTSAGVVRHAATRPDRQLGGRQPERRPQRAQSVLHDPDQERMGGRSDLATRSGVSVFDPTEAVRHRPFVAAPTD